MTYPIIKVCAVSTVSDQTLALTVSTLLAELKLLLPLRQTSVKAKLLICGLSQSRVIVVKAAPADSPVGVGGTGALGSGCTKAGKAKSVSPVPAVGSKGLSFSSTAKPLSTNSLELLLYL